MADQRGRHAAFLVKSKSPTLAGRVSFGAHSAEVSSERLMPSIEPKTRREAWSRLELDGERSVGELWDIAHALTTEGFGVAGTERPSFVEPDLDQQWITGESLESGFSLAKDCAQHDPFDSRYPNGGDANWFTSAAYTDLASARALSRTTQAKVRIAQLDTGLDLEHASLPALLDLTLARNFLDDQPEGDVTDRKDGLLANLGHGTGTIGILAGKWPGAGDLGGAPGVHVVPLRVADAVVLFKNSAIAKALNYVHALNVAGATPVHVITMSMGGLASKAWAEAINALYEQGVFIVTAAGNNYGNLPTRNIVYPARFRRVVAACGVMADGRAYADLPLTMMAGNYGPSKKMKTAMAAYTPNLPWARIGCASTIDLDGAGTSSATPQIAAAAALYMAKYETQLAALPEAWMRVEAVRQALFETSEHGGSFDAKRLGRGMLRAARALAQKPAAASALAQEERDTVSFAALRVLTGLGIAGDDPRQEMLELEALQLASVGATDEIGVEDPAGDDLTPGQARRVAEWLLAQPRASRALRARLENALGHGAPAQGAASALKTSQAAPGSRMDVVARPPALERAPPAPHMRSLRVFARDPLAGTKLETLATNEALVQVPWEPSLEPGPVGEYLEVVDVDPASGRVYPPVDLNHPHLLVQNGLAPSEADPHFHQQMVYAVAMKTIGHFEKALGRSALWASEFDRQSNTTAFVRRLRVYPHALREQNAYYSPARKSLLFGYFSAQGDDVGDNMPGGTVFTCLSHDIIAHETTHALLDGLHSRFREATNPDVLAFHEAFADIVALFQHFSMPEAVRAAVAKTRGDLRAASDLGRLAVQFGQGIGRYGALRSAIGEYDAEGVWRANPVSRNDYANATGSHKRGAVLVSAIFDAYIKIYEKRVAEYMRLATNGTGVLPPGAIPADLVNVLAGEAAKIAGQILNICIRALDYCPPVDLSFGEYLRALITADRDVVPDDRRTYRVAFIDACRSRGIYPAGVRNLSIESVCWQGPDVAFDPAQIRTELLPHIKLTWGIGADRLEAFMASRSNAAIFHKWLMDKSRVSEDQIRCLGLNREHARRVWAVNGRKGKLSAIEVHSLRPSRKVGPDGQSRVDLVVEITQSWTPDDDKSVKHRGGCTILIGQDGQLRYVVRKRVANPQRIADTETAMRIESEAGDPLSPYTPRPRERDEPFALCHREG